MDGENEATRAIMLALTAVQRDLAVLTERMANDRVSRDSYGAAWEVRHKELQALVFDQDGRIDSAERERNEMKRELTAIEADIRQLRLSVENINARIQWFVYLILGLVITAVVAGGLGGALLHRAS